jgi:hypothetical protein
MGHPLRPGSLPEYLAFKHLSRQRTIVRGKNKPSLRVQKRQRLNAGGACRPETRTGKKPLESRLVPGQKGFLQGRIRLQDFDLRLQLLRFRFKQRTEQLLPMERLVVQALIGILLLHPAHPIQRGGKTENKGEGQGKNQRQGYTFSVFLHFGHGIIVLTKVSAARAPGIIPGVAPNTLLQGPG